jgi:hypothetical protein
VADTLALTLFQLRRAERAPPQGAPAGEREGRLNLRRPLRIVRDRPLDGLSVGYWMTVTPGAGVGDDTR